MAFPTITLLDSFKRVENPLGGPSGAKNQWKSFHASTVSLGRCSEGIDWENNSPSDVEGAYWSPIEFSNPGVTITRDRRLSDTGTWVLWSCISNPTTAEISGYRLRAHRTSGSGEKAKFEVKLERCDKNSFTVLSTTTEELYEPGDRFGMAVQEGKVEYWRKKGEGAWEERASAADTKYTKGFVAFTVESALNGDTTNFEAGSAGGSPTVENPGRQHARVFKSTSLQINALNATKYFATNLPTGLSINELTGLITGEPTTVESPLVKIKVESEAKETSETSFEWVVTEGGTNVISMIIG